MKAVICCLNSKYIHSSLAPWCLLAGVRKYSRGIECSVVEGTINEDINCIINRISDEKPDVLGLCCYIWNITEVKNIISEIKNNLPDTLIIMGGPEVSYNAAEVLKNNPLCDYILSGEGELPFAYLLNALDGKMKIDDIPGLCLRKDGKIIVKEPYISEDEPPSPYTDEYFSALNGRIAYLETSRGCPYSCAFCLSGRCGNARFFDIEKSKKLLISLGNSSTKTVKLVDRTFNANRNRAKELWSFIIENYGTAIPDGVCYHFEIAGDIIDDESIKILRNAPVGAMQLEIGLQSFNEKTLKAINRKTDTEKLINNIKALISLKNMHIHIDLIAGLPLEDLDSFKKSFNTAYKLNPNMLQLGFLKLLHGADMREERDKYPCTFSENPPYEIISTPWLSSDDLNELTLVEDALERLYNSGRFKNTLKFLLDTLEITPYQLFKDFSVNLPETSKMSLNEYTRLLFEHFAPIVDRQILRDKLVVDRITTNATGVLPDFLKIKDDNLKKYRAILNENSDTAEIKGIKRGIAILYSQNKIIYCDYINKNPVSGEYKFKTADID